MYSHHLDTPPPQSQFRRPWSPDPYDPLPAAHLGRFSQDRDTSRFLNQDPYNYAYDIPQRSGHNYQGRREPSDVSVEALDLAEYAMTLRPNITYQNEQYYPHDMYPPPQSPPLRPQSRDSMVPPSLTTSHGGTLPSPSTHSGHRPRRPFSLPPQLSSRRTTSPLSAVSHRYPAFGDPRFSSPQIHTNTDPEIDISQFPAWSRNWYHTNTTSPPDDIYTALPKSHFDSKRSPFDPGNVHKYRSDDFDPYNSYAPTTSYGHESSRDMLPWSNDPPEYGPPVDASLKEERMRMLEREFGPNSKMKRTDDAFLDEDGKPLVGTVDAKGQLVTQGPRKRLAVRILQIILAFAATVPAIYAAVVIKPTGKPPPSGTAAAYVLYVVSVITLVGLLGLFLIRPCCCGRRSKEGGSGNPFANGMMVLPVQGLPGGKKTKKAKGGKKGKKGQPQMGDVQVNLIVDPTVFHGGQQESESDDDEENRDWDGSMPGGFDSARRKRKRNAPRRSVFAGFTMEQQWKQARSWAKKITAVDAAGLVIWGAVFVFILIGKRCPIGGFDGWCNAYNTSSAAACLLCLAFAVSIFFDVKDLHSSKVSPRTRT